MDSSKQGNRERYDTGRRADKYERSRWRRELSDEIAAWAASSIATYTAAGPRVLVVGGGVGYKDRLMRDRLPGATVVGLDLGHAPLMERAETFGLALNVQGDMEQLPIATGAFDAACFFGALHHSGRPDETLSETRRVLKPGGCLILVEPVSLKMWLQGRRFEPVGDNVNFKFSTSFLRDAVQRAGFIIRRHEGGHIAPRLFAVVTGATERALFAGLTLDRLLLRRLPGARLIGGISFIAATR
jgi:SAM-dependent methyltransferase